MDATEISSVHRSKQQAKSSYDRLSRWYDLLEGWSETRSRSEGLRMLDVAEGEHVLELGFGTGHGLAALARSVGVSGQVYGLDISEGMLRVARERVRKQRVAGRVHLAVGDAEVMPFDEGRFDAVFMSFVLELFDTPQIPAVLIECQRVLGPGGRLAVVALSKKGHGGIVRRLYEWAHERWPGLVDCRPIFLQAALENAGFYVVQTKEQRVGGLPVEVVLARNQPHNG